MQKEFQEIDNGIWTINNFWSPQRCQTFIQWGEEEGFEEAQINIGFGKQVMNKGIRNNLRLIFDDQELVDDLWENLEIFAPKETTLGRAIGLNERLRFYKYLPGMRFKGHQDGSFIRNINEWSSFTFMVYLNEVEKGGETKFLNTLIPPKTGQALIFKHELWHEGSPIIEGIKYVLRTDIMYRRK